MAQCKIPSHIYAVACSVSYAHAHNIYGYTLAHTHTRSITRVLPTRASESSFHSIAGCCCSMILYFYFNCYYICNGMARNEWENGVLLVECEGRKKQMANRREWNETKVNGTVHKMKRRAKIKNNNNTAIAAATTNNIYTTEHNRSRSKSKICMRNYQMCLYESV